MRALAFLGDLLEARADAHADRLAVREEAGDCSYGALHERSLGIARRLAELGLAPGQRVALMLPNSAAFAAAFFGIVRAGGVVAPMNVRYREQELLYYLADAKAAALLVAPELAAGAGTALSRMERPPALLAIAADGSCRRLRAGQPDAGALPGGASGADTPLLLQYTSGSTGAPKRIVRSHGQLAWELSRLAEAFALGEGDRFLGAAPFSHVNGLVRTLLTSLFVGGTLHPLPEFQRRRALAILSEERISYFGGVPYMYAILAETPQRGRVDLASLRVAFSSSAPLLARDARRFAERYGVAVRQLYGSTETGTIGVNLDPDPAAHPDSVGPPLPGVRVEILDEQGRPAPPGVEGEVAIASPGAIAAYEGNPEASAASFRGGFYLSGDLGRQDARGHLFLTGRKKFLINRGGYKVNPLEVEQAILAHPRVREVVVLGAPSHFGDDVVRCVVVAEGALSAQELVEHCRPRIADFKIPSRIEFRDELPKSATGKILRSRL